jgi:acyl-CoA thioesterase FadM
MTIDERDDVLSATGEIVSAHVDMNVRRQSPFPPALADAFDRLLTQHTALTWPAPVCGTMHA